MRPKSEPKQVERELFQSELEQIIDLRHPLVRLGRSLAWASFESALGATYHPTQGAPGTPTRLVKTARREGLAIKLILATGFGPFAEVNSGPPSAVNWTASVFWQGDGLRAGA